MEANLLDGRQISGRPIQAHAFDVFRHLDDLHNAYNELGHFLFVHFAQVLQRVSEYGFVAYDAFLLQQVLAGPFAQQLQQFVPYLQLFFAVHLVFRVKGPIGPVVFFQVHDRQVHLFCTVEEQFVEGADVIFHFRYPNLFFADWNVLRFVQIGYNYFLQLK